MFHRPLTLLWLFFAPMLCASTWSTQLFQNANLKQQEIKQIQIKNEFQSTFGIYADATNLTTYRLQKKMLKAYDKDKTLKVDIFINDTTPVIDMSDTEKLEGFFLVADPKSNSVTVSTPNGTLSYDESKALFAHYEQRKERKNRLRFEARKANLQTVLTLLDNKLDDTTKAKMQKAIEKGARYVSLNLKPQTIIKLLTYHNGAVGALDKHIDFSASATADPVFHVDQDMRDEWVERFDGYLEKTYMKSMEEDPDRAHLNLKGGGVNIYYSDMKCPDYNDSNKTFFGYTSAESRYTIEDVKDNDGNLHEGYSDKAYHTKIVTGVLSTVSPEAHLTCKNLLTVIPDTTYDNPNETIYDVVLPDDNNANFIESYSLNKYESADENDSTRNYYPMDALFDNHTYDNERLIFIAAGNNYDLNQEGDDNPGNDVVSPGKAFNVVTVGNYKIDENSAIVINAESSYHNPFINGHVSYQKPEVSAPGTDYFYLSKKEKITVNDDNPLDPIHTMHYTDALTSGTSFATPFTAGVAANMISRFATANADEGEYYYDAYLNLPEVFKAGIIAIARDSVGAEDENLSDAERHSRAGEGGVNYNIDPLLMYMRNTDFTLRSDGKTCFETDDYLSNPNASETYMQIDSYNRARAVVVWFNRIDLPHYKQITRIPNTYEMQVIDPEGNVVSFYDYNHTSKAWADEPNQGYQIIDFNTGKKEKGRYNVRICKTDNHDGNDVKMGFALTLKPYAPPHPPAAGVMETIRSYLLF